MLHLQVFLRVLPVKYRMQKQSQTCVNDVSHANIFDLMQFDSESAIRVPIR
jgi:hypothetical protein